MGYILGKAEGVDDKWHGHVTAVTGLLFHVYINQQADSLVEQCLLSIAA